MRRTYTGGFIMIFPPNKEIEIIDWHILCIKYTKYKIIIPCKAIKKMIYDIGLND